MPGVVLDTSAALSWLFADVQTEAARGLARRVARDGAVVPWVWHAEMAQLLLFAERRGRTSPARVAEIVALIDELPIETEAGAPERVRHELLGLARDAALSASDALYLDLARRRGLPLATLDPTLDRAARAAGIAIASGD